jgi:hypothetical protein
VHRLIDGKILLILWTEFHQHLDSRICHLYCYYTVIVSNFYITPLSSIYLGDNYFITNYKHETLQYYISTFLHLQLKWLNYSERRQTVYNFSTINPSVKKWTHIFRMSFFLLLKITLFSVLNIPPTQLRKHMVYIVRDMIQSRHFLWTFS